MKAVNNLALTKEEYEALQNADRISENSELERRLTRRGLIKWTEHDLWGSLVSITSKGYMAINIYRKEKGET